MKPSSIQVQAALEILAACGWTITPPVSPRIQLLTTRQVADIVSIHVDTARDLVASFPNSVRLPGGELRARVADLEHYLDTHPVRPTP